MANSVRIKACGGLGPFSWTITGPATLSSSSGISTTLTCNPGTSDSSPVTVTVTDAVGISTTKIFSGSCSCGGCESAILSATRHPSDCAIDDIFDYYMPGSYSPSVELGGTHPGCASGNGTSTINTAAYDLTLSSGLSGSAKAGFTLWKMTPRFGAAEFVEQTAVYQGPTAGSPISGFCTAVDPASTVCSFTGYVALLDHQAGQLVLGYYQNADISTTYPTVLATGTLPGSYPNNIALDWFDDGGVHQAYLEYFDGDFGGQDLKVNITTGFITAVSNAGFIWIGNNASGTHSARYTATSGWFVD